MEQSYSVAQAGHPSQLHHIRHRKKRHRHLPCESITLLAVNTRHRRKCPRRCIHPSSHITAPLLLKLVSCLEFMGSCELSIEVTGVTGTVFSCFSFAADFHTELKLEGHRAREPVCLPMSMTEFRLLSPKVSSLIRASSSRHAKRFESSVCNVISIILGLLAHHFASCLKKDALS